MPFVSEREERAQLQTAIYDDGSIHAGFSETFDAAVGFAIDEGLSTSRMLNNEMYDVRRKRAKEIFDSGVPRDEFYDERGRINYDDMAQKHEGIKTDKDLFEEKRTLLEQRRNYYNDVMRRSESVSGNLLGSMTGFMLDPINVSTMAIATPIAAAKGISVLGRALYAGAGAAAVNVATEMLIQPFVMDYKLDIDSPYGVDDAITNIAMAAGGGFVLGGMAGGISGWLRKLRADADNIKLSPDLDIDEMKVAVDQVDDLIDSLKTHKFDVEETKAQSVSEVKAELEKTATSIPDEIINKVRATKKKLELEIKEPGANKAEINEKLENIQGILGRREVAKKAAKDLERIEKGTPSKETVAKIEELAHKKQVDAEASYLRGVEEERTHLNRGPDKIDEIETQIITDNDLDGVFRATEKPKVIKDGKMIDAKKIVESFDDDIEALEAMKVCMYG